MGLARLHECKIYDATANNTYFVIARSHLEGVRQSWEAASTQDVTLRIDY